MTTKRKPAAKKKTSTGKRMTKKKLIELYEETFPEGREASEDLDWIIENGYADAPPEWLLAAIKALAKQNHARCVEMDHPFDVGTLVRVHVVDHVKKDVVYPQEPMHGAVGTVLTRWFIHSKYNDLLIAPAVEFWVSEREGEPPVRQVHLVHPDHLVVLDHPTKPELNATDEQLEELDKATEAAWKALKDGVRRV